LRSSVRLQVLIATASEVRGSASSARMTLRAAASVSAAFSRNSTGAVRCDNPTEIRCIVL
jgi:hypothetical protein